MPAKTHKFQNATVTIDPALKTVWTQYDDGLSVAATPNYDDESIERARTLGYENKARSNLGPDYDEDALNAEMVWLMTQDHDVLHTAVAEAAGNRYSAALRPVAEGVPAPDPVAADQEERVVFLVQRALNVGRAILP